jgi:hypothetical protein
MAQDLAESLLAVSGRRVIADLYGAATAARQLGKLDVAGSLIEIAEAAERQWMRRVHSKHAPASQKELVAGPGPEEMQQF